MTISKITKGTGQETIKWESIRGKRSHKYKGPEVGRCPAWSKKRKEATIVVLEEVKSNDQG